MLKSVGLKVQHILNFAPNVLPSDMPPMTDHSTAGHVQGAGGRDHSGLVELHQNPSWDLLGGPLVKTLHFRCKGAQVQYLVRELRCCTP